MRSELSRHALRPFPGSSHNHQKKPNKYWQGYRASQRGVLAILGFTIEQIAEIQNIDLPTGIHPPNERYEEITPGVMTDLATRSDG